MTEPSAPPVYVHDGYCPICDRPVTFRSGHSWFRDNLVCPSCNSVVRERALALVLREMRPNWRALAIHESSPADRGISALMRREGRGYVASHWFPDHAPGAEIKGFRNENLERQSFADASLDLVITLDVMEHVFEPGRVYAEVHRTLKPGGLYLHTFPIQKALVAAARPRATRDPDGTLRHLEEAQYHGNPIDQSGSLVTVDYGYEIDRQIAAWAPFDVRVLRFWDETHGIIGEFTEVVACAKRAF
jgi:SAM-dependent methyltransferase